MVNYVVVFGYGRLTVTVVVVVGYGKLTVVVVMVVVLWKVDCGGGGRQTPYLTSQIKGQSHHQVIQNATEVYLILMATRHIKRKDMIQMVS
ncbi:hypothetical protein ACH5RR_018508 [Cinchona calisaya]|uniref:Secreted protein n=1 Tax=Cinchona calisaya TaxID=153742 RepID=A0ABD2ZM59_9GENT